MVKWIWALGDQWTGVLVLLGLGLVALANILNWRRDQARAEHMRREAHPRPRLTTTPMVSVLVAAWNEATGLPYLIKSFLGLSYPEKELVLCAGGPDGTYREALAYSGPQVIVLEQHPGEGKQRALQRCYEQARGEIIYLTDADCLLSDDAFFTALEPIVMDGEEVTSGSSRPGQSTLTPFLAHQWCADLYSDYLKPSYIEGLLGRNCALTRRALERAEGFKDPVPIGTDYYLAKRLLEAGYRIRYVADSAVSTLYPENWRAYRSQRSRWMRNMIFHGMRFRAYEDVLPVLRSVIVGGAVVVTPLLYPVLGKLGLALWLLLLAHGTASRIRYLKFGERVLKCKWPLLAYVYSPLLLLADSAVWLSSLPDYLLPQRRVQW